MGTGLAFVAALGCAAVMGLAIQRGGPRHRGRRRPDRQRSAGRLFAL